MVCSVNPGTRGVAAFLPALFYGEDLEGKEEDELIFKRTSLGVIRASRAKKSALDNLFSCYLHL